MPRRVDDVRFSMERVLLGAETPLGFASTRSALVFSGDGEGVTDDSVDVGVSSKVRRGMGLTMSD